MWDYNKRSNIYVMRISKGDKEESGNEKIFQEIITEHFLNLAKSINLQIKK